MRGKTSPGYPSFSSCSTIGQSLARREETLAQAVTDFEEGRRQRAASDEAERQRVLAEVKRLELEVEESAAQLKQACRLVVGLVV